MPEVTVQIGGQFPHPPLQFLSLESIGGHSFVAGTYTFTRPAPLGVVPVDAFGFLWSVDVEPLGVGLVPGPSTLFEERNAQVVVHHKMLDGTIINSTVIDSFRDSGFVLFDTFPENVTVKVEVAWQLSFFWMVLI